MTSGEKWIYQYVVNNKKGVLTKEIMEEFKDTIPTEREIYLQRGIAFETEEQKNEFLKQIESGFLKTDDFTSWTDDTETSRDFARGAGLKSENYAGGIVISMLNPIPVEKILCYVGRMFDVGIDLDSQEESEYESYAFNESEYIIHAGVYPVEIDFCTK